MQTVRTLGHGTLSKDEFLAVVEAASLEVVADVRRFPGSRRSPHFASGEMAVWLPEPFTVAATIANSFTIAGRSSMLACCEPVWVSITLIS